MCMELVFRPCPLCGTQDESQVFATEQIDPAQWDDQAFASRKVPEYMHYRLLSCSNCQLVYASPAPTRDALATAYRSAAYTSQVEAEYAARTYVRLVRRVATRLPDRTGVLDIGAGDGALLRKLLGEGFTQVCGVEPSAAPREAADASVRALIRHAAFCGQDFRPESFSLITCLQTIEHLCEPLQTCREAHALLKPGGALLLVLHNRLAVSARILGLKSPIYDIEHLQLFCPHTACLLLEKAGFQQIRVRSIWNHYPLQYWLKLCPLPRRLKSWTLAVARETGIGALPMSLPAGNLVAIGFKAASRAHFAGTRDE